MADSSNTRLDSADAIAEMDKAMGALRWELDPSIWADVDERYRRVRALAASRPAVERLVAALRSCVAAIEDEKLAHDCEPEVSHPAVDDARAVLAEFGQQPTGDERESL